MAFDLKGEEILISFKYFGGFGVDSIHFIELIMKMQNKEDMLTKDLQSLHNLKYFELKRDYHATVAERISQQFNAFEKSLCGKCISKE